jgi:colicin import membrane protein
MAREGLSFGQVAAAAEKMLANGINPTIKGVRDAIGTGSHNTVHKHLQAWRDARPQAVSIAAELPSGIINAINKELMEATALARSEYEERLTQAITEATELSVAGEALEDQNSELVERCAFIAIERDTLVGKSTELEVQVKALSADLDRERAALENARIEIAKSQITIDANAKEQTALTNENSQLKADAKVIDGAHKVELKDLAATHKVEVQAIQADLKAIELLLSKSERATDVANERLTAALAAKEKDATNALALADKVKFLELLVTTLNSDLLVEAKHSAAAAGELNAAKQQLAKKVANTF